MWDPIPEKATMLSRVGDFYYNILHRDDISIVRAFIYSSMQCRSLRQLENIKDWVNFGGYFEDNYKLIHFDDESVEWYEIKDVLQRSRAVNAKFGSNSRYRTLTFENTAGLDTESDKNLTDAGTQITAKIDETDGVVLPENVQLVYTLRIPDDLYVRAIQTHDNHILYAGTEFQSEFGKLTFTQNPITLFPKMQFMAKSYVQRKRSLYCYPLSVDVYGPVDRILHYYKYSQSAKALYYASAQAAGFPIVKEDCKILSVTPLLDGVTYVTDTGNYDAPFPHTFYTVGTELKEGQIIAAEQLYKLVSPYEPIPMHVQKLELDYMLPVKGLIAERKEITLKQDGKWKPAFTGDRETLEKYWKFCEEWQAPISDEIPDQYGDALTYVLTTICANRYVIACINKDHMSKDMQLKLIAFLQRERPLGSVLFVSNLSVQINQNS